MRSFLTAYASLSHCYTLCQKSMPWFVCLGLLSLLGGLGGGLWIAPPDYQQGDAFRILYVHVPCAFFSLLIYVAMASCSFIYLIWKIKIADIVAYSLAPLGTVMTGCALITGAIWGKPMWGTWWQWDARLTSELILLFLYLGYWGLSQTVFSRPLASKMRALFAIVGVIDIPIIHYSVQWWHTLHQGATLRWFQAPLIASSMLWPLLCMLVAFGCYSAALLCIGVRTEILHRSRLQCWVKNQFLEEGEK